MYEESYDLIYLLLVSCWRQMVVVEWHKVAFKQSHQQNKIDTVVKL